VLFGRLAEQQEVAQMSITPHPDQVRQIVLRNLRDFGVCIVRLDDLRENIRVEQGRYLARTYRAGHLMAMWLVPYGILQFYDSQGAMLRTINLFEELKSEEVAA
jgi:hypothetical protein